MRKKFHPSCKIDAHFSIAQNIYKVKDCGLPQADAQTKRGGEYMKNCLYCIDVYTVSEGDTLYSIAEKYELPVSLLMKVNGIENPYNLQIGTRLCIPGTEDQLPPAPEKCMTTHTVKAGDTLYLIAKMHNIKLDALMRANPSIDPYNLLIGTELCIPV